MDLLGKPVIYYSLKAFEEAGFSSIVLVCGKDDVEYCKTEIIEKYDLHAVSAVVPGGKERYWEQVPLVYRKKNYAVEVCECFDEDIVEIDTFRELKQIDKTYDV